MSERVPDLATLREMYPVDRESVRDDDMVRVALHARALADELNGMSVAHRDGYLDTFYTDCAIRLNTPIKRATFAVLLTLLTAAESEGR